MTIAWIGLALLVIGALLGLLQQKWSAAALLLVVAGFALTAFGFVSSRQNPAPLDETILASDKTKKQSGGAPAQTAPAAEGQELKKAPQIPEHVITAEAKPWVAEVKKIVENPDSYTPIHTGIAQKGLNEGDQYFEYANVKLAGRALAVVFLSRGGKDVWMLHIEPAGKPIEAQELGSVAVIGEGDGFVMFQIKDGPFAGDYLVWSTDGEGQGGKAVRIYTPAYLEREHARSQKKS